MNHSRRHTRGFTLIETMLAVLLLALLASGAAMSFSQPIKNARSRQAIAEIQGADQAARLDAKRMDLAVRLTFDMNASTIRLYERQFLRSQTTARIDRMLIGEKLIRGEPATIDFSGSGYSPSYAVHTNDTWLVIHGLTGQATTTTDEKTSRSILNPPSK